MTNKILADYQRDFDRIIHLDQPFKDRLLSKLMTEMEQQYGIPMMKNEEWERENWMVLAMYLKISASRTL